MGERLFAVVGIIILLAGAAVGLCVYIYGNQATEIVKSYPSGNDQLDITLNGRATKGIIQAARFRGGNKEVVSVQDAYGMTRLHWAAARGHIPMAKLLLAEGAEVDVSDLNGQTPLIVAAANGQIEIVNILIRRRADVTARDSIGKTAAVYADENGHTEIAEIIRQKGGE